MLLSRSIFLLALLIIPLMLIVILKIAFTGRITLDSYNLVKFYKLLSISLLAAIPAIFGIISAKLYLITGQRGELASPENQKNTLRLRFYGRATLSFISSLVVTWATMEILNPVPAQGWLRTLYAAILFALQSPASYFINSENRAASGTAKTIRFVYWILLILLPVGLLLHHPYNYPVFVSPFYWSAWAWMITPPWQGLICGIISVFLTTAACYSVLRKELSRF